MKKCKNCKRIVSTITIGEWKLEVCSCIGIIANLKTKVVRKYNLTSGGPIVQLLNKTRFFATKQMLALDKKKGLFVKNKDKSKEQWELKEWLNGSNKNRKETYCGGERMNKYNVIISFEDEEVELIEEDINEE